MNKIICGAFLLLIIQGLAFAADEPAVFTGTIGKPSDPSVAAAIGHNGVLFIRDQARWDEFSKLLPQLKPDKPLPKLDFAKQSVLLVYASGCRGADVFSCDKLDVATPEFDFFWVWDNSPEDEIESRHTKFILAVIDTTPTVKVVLKSEPRQNKGERIVTEFSAILGGKDGGDIVDGLQAAITRKAASIKPGEDIQIDFTVHLADPGDARPEQFGSNAKSVIVWDDSGPEGYRNHAFFVTTPDGKTSLLRPKEIQWFRTPVLHPVEITAKQPYTLPGKTAQSLKELGLETSTPGIYIITGLYEETGREEVDEKPNKPMWGGSIVSNSITVEVKP